MLKKKKGKGVEIGISGKLCIRKLNGKHRCTESDGLRGDLDDSLSLRTSVNGDLKASFVFMRISNVRVAPRGGSQVLGELWSEGDC